MDDLGVSLVQVAKAKETKKKKVVVVQPSREAQLAEEEKSRTKGKQLVFDEQSGEVVVKRKRKGSRTRSDWEEFDDVDDFLDDEL